MKKTLRALCGAIGFALLATAAPAQQQTRTRNVVLIVTDGLRWQEVFGGADSALISRRPGGVEDTAGIRREFWRADPGERRRAMMPFLWDVVAKQGQIWGSRDRGSVARVTNGLNFSYPGYHEMLAGFPDARIDSNEHGPNPNVTVFEWLAKRPGYEGKVGALATWDAFADIFNRRRAGIFVHAGWEPFALDDPAASPVDLARRALLDTMYRTTVRLWGNNAYDAFTQRATIEYVRAKKPRVLFVGYGETDEWQHSGRYDRLLTSARQVDAFIRELWEGMQRMPEYRGTTTFIITTDHGRGGLPDGWKSHGEKVAGADAIWIAVLGPDTPALGERGADTPPVTQSQIAATMAALLGEDWQRAEPKAAAPIAQAVKR